MKYIVAVGNLVNGMNFFGPFESVQEAQDFAKTRTTEWQIVILLPPPR